MASFNLSKSKLISGLLLFFLSILVFLSAMFWMERIIILDASFQIFSIIIGEVFAIMLQRYVTILSQFIPLILIFAIMYFLLIRPQQRKLKDHKKMVESLRRGDMIVTQGGLIGKVTKVKEDNEIEVELSEGVKVRVVQSTVAQVLSKTEPAA